MNRLNMMLLVSAFVCGALHASDATTEGEREEAKMSTQVAALVLQASPSREITVVPSSPKREHHYAHSWPACFGTRGEYARSGEFHNQYAFLKPPVSDDYTFPGQR